MSAEKRGVLIIFSNISQALHMEKCCKRAGIEGALIPTPKEISASCSISWKSPEQYEALLYALLEAENIKPQGFCKCLL